MPRLAAGCGSSNRDGDTGWAMTPFCSQRHVRRARANARSTLGLASARRGVAPRLPAGGTEVVLVEVDAGLARLAAENAQLNGLRARVSSVVVDVAAPARAFAAAQLGPESVARVLMNAPFNDPARQRASPDGRRRLAHAGSGAALPVWIKTAARLLRPRGTLTMIWRAGGLARVLQALAPVFGAVAVLPVHPGEEKAAIRVLVRATKASRAPLALLPAFVLNDRSGRPTAQAESVLRAGAALPLSEI